VIHELADKRHACGVRRIVTVVRAQLGLGDQPDGSDLEGVESIHHPARSAALDQRLSQFLARLGERREIEQPDEPVGTSGAFTTRTPILAVTAWTGSPVAVATTTSTATALPITPRTAFPAVFIRLCPDDRRGDDRRSDPRADRSEEPPSRFGLKRLRVCIGCRFD